MRYSRLSKDIEMEQEKRKGEYGGRFGRVKRLGDQSIR